MASAFRSESRTTRRFVGLPSLEKASLWPTVDAILAEARDDAEEIGDQIVFGSLNDVLIKGIVTRRYSEVHRLLGKLLQLDGQDRKSTVGDARHFPSGKSLPDQEAKPRERAAAVSDAEMRRLAGAPTKLPR